MTVDRSAASWEGLRSAGIVRSVAAGETLFRSGDEADGAYVVLAGSCVVVEDDDTVSPLSPGDIFGEIATLAGGTRTADVVAIEDSELLFLSLQELREGFNHSPEHFWQALRLIVERLKVITRRQLDYRVEHKALQEVQRSLLPDLAEVRPARFGLDVEALWEPCSYASGDYYDVIALDEHRCLLAIGDVMGHGAEASLMMGIARAQIRELARAFRRTDELLLNLDGYLRDNAPPKQGMSLVVAVHDSRERVVEYSVAGHPMPMLARDGVVTDLPGRPGILLALPFLVGAGYERRELELTAGDRLLFFTDGLFEIPVDDEQTQLGRSGLATMFTDLLEQHEAGNGDLLTALVARVSSAHVGPPLDDDRTALLVGVR